ncbi:glycosyltransferase family 4 protein [Mongoliitalea lutea]|uniref:Glycosyl transferase family 1 domain-containing protein n=1 Tax=Mongoliitalea lutea TaxID=849756 RepID=A0A8J3G5M8_9BACT|nr:glycosyltransferase family 4 protein [Mongoliitalea lutea]GHB37224.1 hypothetical protein GCM10008106_18150 [Mongoliitalea lutea]
MNGLDRMRADSKINSFDSLKDKRFLFVVNTLRGFGGAERQSLILATYIKKNISSNVFFLAFEDGGEFRLLLEEARIEVHCFTFKHQASKFKKAFQYFRLIQFVKPLKPDFLIPYVAESNKIVAQIWKYTGAMFAFWNQREEGRKLFGTSHEKKIISKVPAIISNSFEGRDALVRVYNLNPDEITVINNGIIPYTDEIEDYDWHSHFKIERHRPLVSMVANITSRKDHFTLFKAWQLVIFQCRTKQMPLPFLVLAGRLDDTYDDLRLLGFDLNLSDSVGFTGSINPVQSLIKNSLFCVFSSNLEGCPNGVLECMEQGKAVIATNISGVMQALGTTYADICLSQPNNHCDLADKIMNLYQQPYLIKEIGIYNSNRITKEFSVEQMVTKHLQIIEDKLKRFPKV